MDRAFDGFRAAMSEVVAKFEYLTDALKWSPRTINLESNQLSDEIQLLLRPQLLLNVRPTFKFLLPNVIQMRFNCERAEQDGGSELIIPTGGVLAGRLDRVLGTVQ